MCQNPAVSKATITLSTTRHDRDAAGLIYVYPVVSRRAGGVSLGVNLNPNNACNWRCIYCQVPNLQRGGPPPVDLPRLATELRDMLQDILHGDFMQLHVPEGARRLNDIALSGNGEPTSAAEFPQVVALIGRVMTDFDLLAQDVKLVLITNGSLAHRPDVLAGIRAMAALNGEVWFKFDRATRAGLQQVNATQVDPERHYQRLKTVAGLCPTWIQTCMFALDGQAPPETEIRAYLNLLARARAEGIGLRGVLLYGLARTPMQPEAPRLSPLDREWLQVLAERIQALGLTVKLTP